MPEEDGSRGYDLATLKKEGILDSEYAVPLIGIDKLGKDGVILYQNGGGIPFRHCQADEWVYLFSEMQARNFRGRMLDSAKKYQISAIRDMGDLLKEGSGHSYRRIRTGCIGMNPNQLELFLSLGVEKAVLVRVSEMTRTFRHREKGK